MKRLAAALAVLLVLGSTAAACWMVNVWHESDLQETKIVELRKMAEKEPATDLKGGKPTAERPALPKNDTAVQDSDKPVLHDISLLKEKNPDCVGWVSIPGTGIDFPIMQNGDFYLKHDFEGIYTDYGLPFLDERCSLDSSDNLIIYGHHMNDAQAERNESLGIRPNKAQLEFAQRYVYSGCFRRETWEEYYNMRGMIF